MSSYIPKGARNAINGNGFGTYLVVDEKVTSCLAVEREEDGMRVIGGIERYKHPPAQEEVVLRNLVEDIRPRQYEKLHVLVPEPLKRKAEILKHLPKRVTIGFYPVGHA